MPKRWLIRKDGVRQRYNIKQKTIKKRGYLYSRTLRALQLPTTAPIAISPELEKELTKAEAKEELEEEKKKVYTQVSNKRQIEENIHDSIFHSIDHVGRKLADKIPIIYDEEEDLWVANDYPSAKHPIPIEIKMRVNEDGQYEVISYQFRGDEDNKVRGKLQRSLNGR